MPLLPEVPRSEPTPMTPQKVVNAGAGSGFVMPSAGMSALGRKLNAGGRQRVRA